MGTLNQAIAASQAVHCKTQRAAILRLLIDARGAWVPLPEIIGCAAQYNSRLWDLRRLGFQIENKTERDDSGVVHSWYRLVASPKSPEPSKPEAPTPVAAVIPDGDWYEREHGPRPSHKSIDSQGSSGLLIFDRAVRG